MAVSRLVPDPNAPAAAGYAAPGSSAPDMAPATPAAVGDRFWQGIAAGTETGDAAASTTTTYTLQIGQSPTGEAKRFAYLGCGLDIGVFGGRGHG